VEEGRGSGNGNRRVRMEGRDRHVVAKAGEYTIACWCRRTSAGTDDHRYSGGPRTEEKRGAELGNGSIVIVVATDAPVDARNLRRMAARTMFGLARTGADGLTEVEITPSLFPPRAILRS